MYIVCIVRDISALMNAWSLASYQASLAAQICSLPGRSSHRCLHSAPLLHEGSLNSALFSQAAAPSDSDDEDEFIYNPLKLPLGYDGKPIPYWLYKLHGLNQVQS